MEVLLLFSLIFSFSAWATTLEKIHSATEGTSRIVLSIDKKMAQFIKYSNYFDHKKDYRLGRFSLPSDKLESTDKKLKSILKSVSKTNDSPLKPHESFFILEGKKISKDSTQFMELEKILTEARENVWNLEEGIVFSSDLKTKTIVKTGLKQSIRPFDFRFYCQKPAPPTYCKDKEYGILYVE
jgi:hypothetical protein